MKTANGMAIFLGCALTFSVSAMDKTAGGAVAGAIGAAVGAGAAAVTGNSVLQGAALGAGAGGMIGKASR